MIESSIRPLANPFGKMMMMYIGEEAFTRVCVCVKAPLGACAVGSSRNKRGWGGCDPSPSMPQQEVTERGGGSHY